MSDAHPSPTHPRPLVVRCGAVGDMVLLTPLLALLHRRYGIAPDVLASGNWTPELYAGHPHVGSIFLLGSRRRPYWSDPRQWRISTALQRRRPGPVFLCDERAVTQIRLILARGGTRERDLLWVGHCGDTWQPHWVDRWLAFGAQSPAPWPAPAAVVAARPTLTVTATAQADLRQWLQAYGLAGKRLILLQPGNKRTLKRGRLGLLGNDKVWPTERWVEIMQGMASNSPDAILLLTGAPSEQAMLRHLQRASRLSQTYAVASTMTISRLLALCANAAGMLAVDTGPAHMAAALGCPLIVLYGSSSPSTWLPRGPGNTPVIALGGPENNCIKVADIPVKTVLEAWNTLPLRGKPATICTGMA